MAPSTDRELVYKVISPHIPTDYPYASEIDAKYYAIHELVVRENCSCYGHAQRCIP